MTGHIARRKRTKKVEYGLIEPLVEDRDQSERLVPAAAEHQPDRRATTLDALVDDPTEVEPAATPPRLLASTEAMPHARRKPLGQGVQALDLVRIMDVAEITLSERFEGACAARPTLKHGIGDIALALRPVRQLEAGGDRRATWSCPGTARAAAAHDRAAHATTQPVRIEQLIELAPVALARAQQPQGPAQRLRARNARGLGGADRVLRLTQSQREAVVAQHTNEADEAPGQRRCRCLRQHHVTPPCRAAAPRPHAARRADPRGS